MCKSKLIDIENGFKIEKFSSACMQLYSNYELHCELKKNYIVFFCDGNPYKMNFKRFF